MTIYPKRYSIYPHLAQRVLSVLNIVILHENLASGWCNFFMRTCAAQSFGYAVT